MNTEMLIKVRDAILAKPPENFAMKHWIKNLRNGNPLLEDDGSVAACGTSMCIAGWAVFLSDDQTTIRNILMRSWAARSDLDVAGSGAKLLGISLDEANLLFYRDKWPRHLGGICADDWEDADEICGNCLDGVPEDCEWTEMSERDGALTILDYMISNDRMPW